MAPETGTGTRRVVVCSTVVVEAGATGAVVVAAVVVSFEAVDAAVVAEVACAAERPPDAIVPATSAPAAKTTTSAKSFAAVNTDPMMTDLVRPAHAIGRCDRRFDGEGGLLAGSEG